MALSTDGASDELERAVVAAYLKGALIPEIKQQFGLSATTVYALLRRSGRVPLRADRRTGDDGTDALIAGLREWVDMQEREIQGLKAEVTALKRAAAVRDRAERNRTG